MDEQESMLTTTDNPYNPFTQYDEWYMWDERMGYCTTGYLARITRTSSELSEADQAAAIDQAMNEIIKENINGLYKIVSKKVSV